ncbi:MBOAT family protein [Campylobacter sp. FMV-PI01]|uniref:MBOAT family protein n=1 Tax=Campylobacter portucalensis TaxID=2608384 RepID=A0A6L5WI64_9BACT|nr:MBOAT family O-acyltransferase [Campylobacter portucalensis]MSN96596.1 MBOAT family protein [Campylobacter portucalensis]
MLFNSYEFIFIFLPLVFLGYFGLNFYRLVKASKVFLILSSLFFYGYFNIFYLPLLLLSIFFNYYMSICISKFKNRKILLFGIFFNIILLGIFKYTDFLIENINFLFNVDLKFLNILLPLALSFITFQQIAFLIDTYHSKIEKINLLDFSLFITFFPQLIAGPIVHHKEMMPQFFNLKNSIINHKNICAGLFIFAIGLFKKSVIADSLSKIANEGFNSVEILNFTQSWITSLSYTFQLYFDFSGYCDMAIGIALLFNIRLPINFNSPYKATNIQDFWRRWHMTLSRFLRDYIYIPLGGNKMGEGRTYFNIFIVFLIGGLWHGASWNFIFWGFLHGVANLIYRLWLKTGIRLNKFISWFILFNFLNITWVFFRASNFQKAIEILSSMLNFKTIILPIALKKYLYFLINFGIEFDAFYLKFSLKNTAIFLSLSFLICFVFKNSTQILDKFKTNLYFLFFTLLCLYLGIIFIDGYTEFLYFNF